MFLLGDATGVQAVADSLNTNVTPDVIWGSIQPFMPFVTSMLVVGIGIYVFRRVLGKTRKLKTGV